MAIQKNMADARDDILNQYLFTTKSPTLNPNLDPDIFDVEGKTIKVPESVYKYHRKRNERMPSEYLPPELQRPSGSSFATPFFPEEGEQVGDWSVELMPEENPQYPWVDEEQTEYLNRMGIDASGAPIGVVRTASWLPNESFSITEGGGVEKVLRDHYPDATEPDGTPWDFAIKQEPRTQRLIYRDPERGGQYQTLFAPGLQFSDVAAELPELIGEIGAGLLAVVATSPGGPVPMTAAGISGEALAATGMRWVQLNRMREKGYLSPRFDNDMVLLAESAKHGGMVGAFGIGGAALFSLLRRTINKIPGGENIAPKVEWDEDVFVDAVDQVMKEADELGGTTAEIAATLTSPQIILHSSVPGAREQPASEMWQQLKDASTRAGKEYDPVRERLAAQEKIKERTLREQFAEGTEETLEEVAEMGPSEMARRGDIIQEGLETQKRPAVEKLETEIIGLEDEALSLADDFAAGALPKGEAGFMLRDSLNNVKNKVDDILNAKYDQLELDIQGNPVFDTTDLMNWAKKNKSTIDRDILPSLAIEDGRIIEDILNLGKKTEPGAGKKVSYDSLKRAITNVNTLLGKAQGAVKSGASTPQIGFLKQLKNELKGLREQLLDPDTAWGKGILERNPNILKELAETERRYFKVKENFARSIVGDILRKKQSSGTWWDVGDEAVVDKLILNNAPDERRVARAILNTPEGLMGLEAIRSSIKGMYKNRMTDAAGDVKPLTNAQHNAFMNKYGDAMEEWLDPADFRKFKNSASASKQVLKDIKSLEKTRAEIAKFPWGSEALLSKPEDLFKMTFRAGEVTPSKELRRAINGLGKEQKDSFINLYKGMIYKDFVDKTSDVTKLAGDKVSLDLDPKKVIEYLDKHSDAMAEWYGKDFVKGLNGWADHIRALLPRGTASLDPLGDVKMKAGMDIVRAYVGIFTRPGRVITALLRFAKSGKERKIIEALLNPEKLRNTVVRDKFLSSPLTQAVARDIMAQEWGEDATQLDPEKRGYTKDQTGTEIELELFGAEEGEPLTSGEWAEKSTAIELNPTPFNTGGPARLIKLNHGY